MSTDVTAVITRIKDSNPVIEFTEESTVQSTHDVRYEMGYDITNNKFVLGDGINRTSGLNNALFSIDDATQQITLGPRTELIDSTICLQTPKLSGYMPKMKDILSECLGISSVLISIKATTTEKLGFIGKEDGVSSYATVLIQKNK